MKKRLRIYFFLITSVAVLAVLGMTTVIFYNVFQKEVMENLALCARVLGTESENVTKLQEGLDAEQMEQVRITLVEPSGKVLFDTDAQSSEMENHKERPEIQGAIKNGEGQSIRESTTLSKSLFYYAVRQSDGNILRISKESESFISFLMRVSPMIAGVILILVFVGFVLTRYLSNSFVRPIEKLASDIEKVRPDTSYRELAPLLQTIQKQHEDIVKSSKMRQEFTANVSHELKTPLTSISGYSELIENGMAKEEDSRRFAGEIHKNAGRLLTLINDILQLSELDSQDFSADFVTVELEQVVKNCIKSLELNASGRGVRLTYEGAGMFPVTGSPKMLEELVYNLIDNGIRYNKENGTVNIVLENCAEGTRLRVRDSGIGIKEEDLERVFERFYRVDKSRSKATGGTGLGLAIVKHIVESHGASIGIESKEGEGTEITVTFQKTNE